MLRQKVGAGGIGNFKNLVLDAQRCAVTLVVDIHEIGLRDILVLKLCRDNYQAAHVLGLQF